MPYRPGFRARSMSQSERQAYRYDNLAEFMKRIAGKSSGWLTRANIDDIRGALLRSRVIDRHGYVQEDKMERWGRRRGFTGHYPRDTMAWNEVVEGESP